MKFGPWREPPDSPSLGDYVQIEARKETGDKERFRCEGIVVSSDTDGINLIPEPKLRGILERFRLIYPPEHKETRRVKKTRPISETI